MLISGPLDDAGVLAIGGYLVVTGALLPSMMGVGLLDRSVASRLRVLPPCRLPLWWTSLGTACSPGAATCCWERPLPCWA